MSSLLDITSSLHFLWTVLELLLDWNCLIFKMPYKKLILTFIRSKDCVTLPENVAGNLNMCEEF